MLSCIAKKNLMNINRRIETKGDIMTNGDKIRSMSNEELWHFLNKVVSDECSVCAFKDNPIKCNRNCNIGFLEWCEQELSQPTN